MEQATQQKEQEEPLPPRGQSPSQRWAEVLLIVLVFFTLAGDPPPHLNESHYLCRLKHYWNPDWCQGDLFLDSADTQLAFIWAFGWVTRWLSLTATAWVGRLLVWTLLAWAWQRLSWRLVPRPLAAVLSAALFVTLTNLAHLAGEWVVGGVEAKCFAYVFVLLALRELIDHNWNRLWLLLGVASAFHPIVGGWTALVCAGIWCIDDRRRVAIASMLPGLLGGGLLALLGVVPALRLTWNESPQIVAEANRIYVFDRLSHHLALWHLPAEEIAARLQRHGALLLILATLGWASRRYFPPTTRSPQLANSSRDPDLPSPIPGIYFAGLRRIEVFAWGAVLVAVIGTAIELILWNHPLIAARLLKYYWFRLTDFAAPMAVALFAVALITMGIDRRRPWSIVALSAALLFAGWHTAGVSFARYSNPVPPADGKMRDYAAWAEVCQWIAENTPENALFLTPYGAQSFKWRTGRPEVATRKDIPQDARGMVEWYQRLRDIAPEETDDTTEPAQSLDYFDTEHLRRIAEEYGADYIVTRGRKPLALTVVYPQHVDFANDEYVVYRVDRQPDDRE